MKTLSYIPRRRKTRKVYPLSIGCTGITANLQQDPDCQYPHLYGNLIIEGVVNPGGRKYHMVVSHQYLKKFMQSAEP